LINLQKKKKGLIDKKELLETALEQFSSIYEDLEEK